MISFGPSACTDLNAAQSREWLETNGIGGFASSTICGMNRRRYHALLIAATKPPVGRMVLLSKLEETLVLGERRIDLSTNQYDGAVHPQGFQRLSRFRLDPFPVFTFSVDGVEVEKSVFMVHGENTTVVQYKLLRAPVGSTVRLEVRPLTAFRDYHATTHANDALRKEFEQQEGVVRYRPYDQVPALYLAHNADAVRASGDWYFNLQYAGERERGLDHQEDLFNPCVLDFLLMRSVPASIIASTEARSAEAAEELRALELRRRVKVAAAAPAKDPFAVSLTLAADQFLARRGDDWTVLAGYPWFTDWGRDTMIALPGLTLFTGRAEIARSVLVNFAKFVDRGMLPNRFPDAGEQPEYNTVDATLWYFEAIRKYGEVTGDRELGRQLYPTLASIIDWHVQGTRYGIKVDEDGLLHAGEPGVQLTWMDAKVGDWVVTPRIGKPVEIQALWYNALKTMEGFAQEFGKEEDQKRFLHMAALLQWTFQRVFWNEAEQCLFDVVNGDTPDTAIRPNQIFAVSLHHSMVPIDRAKAIVNKVERELLTPYGLRTLSPRDPSYCPHFAGDMRARDTAYHQGTVWPWLLGPFCSAYVKVYGRSAEVRHTLLARMEPLQQHLMEQGLGQIAEVFDADPPHAPGGCFAQAWSVAELLRTLSEDVQEPRRKAVAPKSALRKGAGAGRRFRS